MRVLTAALSVLAMLVLLTATSGASPTVTYPISIALSWQGDPLPVPTDVDILDTDGTSLGHWNVLQGSPISVTVAAPPPYMWRVKGFWHLATGGDTPTEAIDAGEQRVGDAPSFPRDDTYCPIPPCYRPTTGDNRVEALDFTLLVYWFGRPRPCCRPGIGEFSRVDFNLDGRVDVIDFSLFKPNYGFSGYEFPTPTPTPELRGTPAYCGSYTYCYRP